MAIRRVTVGRALVLLLAGMGIGVGIFLFHHLRPEEVERRVRETLREILAGDFHFREASLNLSTGVEIFDIEAYYPDQGLAISARRVSVTLDHEALLSGETIVRQVELTDAQVHLRPNEHNIPDLPGILRSGRSRTDTDVRFPIIVRGNSRLTLHHWPTRERSIPVELDCHHIELRPQGNRYELTAEFSGERVQGILLDGSYDTQAKALHISRASIRGLRWSRDQSLRLAQLLPTEDRPPIVLAGAADLELTEPLTIRDPADLLDLSATAQLRELDGKFGNLHTFKAHGLPFRISSGRCDVGFSGRKLKVSNLGARFAGRAGDQGEVLATYTRDFGRRGDWEDWTLTGRGIYATPRHLQILLPEDVAQKTVGPFSPGGTFDFEVSLSHRPGFPEKVHADVHLRDARFEYRDFRYPLDSCSARIQVETNVARPRGPCDVIRFRVARGPDIWDLPPGSGIETLCFDVRGRIDTYVRRDAPEDNPEVSDIEIRVANIPFDERLETALDSAGMQDGTYHAFNLGGRAERVYVHMVSDDFGEMRENTVYEVRLKDCTAAYERFPLPLEGVSGRIIKRSNPPLSVEDGRPLPVLEFVNLRARARDGGRLTAHGEMREDGNLEVIVEAKDLVLGNDMAATLSAVAATDPQGTEIWKRLKPSGKVDVEVHVDSTEREQLTVWIDLGGRTHIAGYEDFAYPVRGLEGSIFYRHKRLELSAVKGRLGEALVTLDGFHEGQDEVMNLYGVVSGPLEERLLAQLNRVFSRKRIVPHGFHLGRGTRFRYEVWAHRATADSDPVTRAELSDLHLRGKYRKTPLRLEGGRVRIDGANVAFGGMRLSEEGGTAWIDVVSGQAPLEDVGRSPTVDLRAKDLDPATHLTALFGDSLARFLGPGILVDLPLLTLEQVEQDGSIRLNGSVDLHRGEGGDEPATGLGPTGILTLSKVRLEPKPARGGAPRLTGDIRFKDLNVTAGWAPRDMNGVLHADECRIGEDFVLKGRVTGGEGKLLDFFCEDLRLDLDYELDNLRLSRIDGTFHKGRLVGEIAVHAADPGAYKVSLAATDVDLHDMLRPLIGRAEPIGGVLEFRIELHSLSGALRDQAGSASVSVKEGQLIEVPGLRRVISLLSRATPFGDAGARFEEAAARVRIRGETVYVDRLHFSTTTSDVHLKGRMTLYGDLDLVVRPQVTRLIDLPRLINIPVLSKLRDLWHKIAYDIRLEGTISSPALRLRALPWLRKHREPFIQSPHAGRIRRMRPRVLP